MVYFTFNVSKIYESFSFWNKLQEKKKIFHNIFFLDVPTYVYKNIYIFFFLSREYLSFFEQTWAQSKGNNVEWSHANK